MFLYCWFYLKNFMCRDFKFKFDIFLINGLFMGLGICLFFFLNKMKVLINI